MLTYFCVKVLMDSGFIQQRSDLKRFDLIYKSLNVYMIIKILLKVFYILINRQKTFQKWLKIEKDVTL